MTDGGWTILAPSPNQCESCNSVTSTVFIRDGTGPDNPETKRLCEKCARKEGIYP